MLLLYSGGLSASFLALAFALRELNAFFRAASREQIFAIADIRGTSQLVKGRAPTFLLEFQASELLV
jgi:hypothetical protein